MAVDPFEMDELLGAYALDAVDDDERRAVEDYLLANPRARAEVQQHREVATMLAWSGMDAPDGLWERIAGSLDQRDAAPASELGAVISLADRRSRGAVRTVAFWALASAAAAIIAVVAIKVSGSDTQSSSAGALENSVAAAMADPASKEAQLVASSAGLPKVRAVVDPQGHGYLLGGSLAELDGSRTYQLWGQVDGQLISLGLLGARPGIEAFTVSGNVTLLAITDEQQGGVVQPSAPPLVAGPLT